MRHKPPDASRQPSAPDRLGDAIRELARTMAEQGRSSMRLKLVSETRQVTYEVRVLSVRLRVRGNVHQLRPAADHIIETEAFGPEHRSRQMAANEKE